MALYLNLTSKLRNCRGRSVAARLFHDYRTEHQRRIIGEREIVGNGLNSELTYVDNPAFPFPAIRFRERTSEIIALREKEKGNWHRLTKEEKKNLYRVSFCQTFAEMQADSGQWKSTVGFTLLWISGALWTFMGIKWLCFSELPDSFYESRQQEQQQRMIDLEVNPITGLASKWDYEKGEWKKKGFFS